MSDVDAIASDIPTSVSEKSKPESSPRKKRSIFGFSGRNSTKSSSSNTPKKQRTNKRNTSKKNNANPNPSNNSTSSDTKQNVIVVGGPNSSQNYRVIRTSSSQPGMIRPQDRNMLMAELITALVRLATHLWLVLWITRMATEHETIKPVQRFVWERLNDRYEKDTAVLKAALEEPPMGITRGQWRRQHNWRVLKRTYPRGLPLQETFNRTVVVIPLGTDSNGNLNVPLLKDIVNFLITQYRNRAFGVAKDGGKEGQVMPLEVLILIKSGGGSVAQYGLAAAQVERLAKEEGITLTSSVDLVAASGGYMVACQADRILAAPFATVGSIGVLMETLNFRDLARSYGITPISLKSGKHKNTLSSLGEITTADQKYETMRLQKVHESFQELVIASRPALATRMDLLEGQVFLGSEAVELGLVDQVMTSDEYIQQRVNAGDRVLRLHQPKLRHSRGLIQISPLDLLPHIRTRVSSLLVNNPDKVASFLMSAATCWGFASHIFRQIMSRRDDGY